MSDNIKLGQLLDGTEERDAIHVAIVPVIANERLKPGEKVALAVGSQELVYKSKFPIGIIDPFLEDVVERGQRCYLCLYPNTVTGMRHHWRHPAFSEKHESDIKKDDKYIRILKNAAEEGDMGYNFFLDCLSRHAEDENYYKNMGTNEAYSNITGWDEIWEAWGKVTGKPVPEDRYHPFSCSC